jgi:hypothetical protein
MSTESARLRARKLARLRRDRPSNCDASDGRIPAPRLRRGIYEALDVVGQLVPVCPGHFDHPDERALEADAVTVLRGGVDGMVLLTGYLGGAIASYVRMREPYPVLVPLTTCLLLWLGLYLREERLRALLPFRR